MPFCWLCGGCCCYRPPPPYFNTENQFVWLWGINLWDTAYSARQQAKFTSVWLSDGTENILDVNATLINPSYGQRSGKFIGVKQTRFKNRLNIVPCSPVILKDLVSQKHSLTSFSCWRDQTCMSLFFKPVSRFSEKGSDLPEAFLKHGVLPKRVTDWPNAEAALIRARVMNQTRGLIYQPCGHIGWCGGFCTENVIYWVFLVCDNVPKINAHSWPGE